MTYEVQAPMAGTILSIESAVGTETTEDTVVLIMESMKMEVPVEAGADGKVVKILCEVGDIVEHDQVLFEIAQ